jgi:thioredoxin-related protein
MKNCFRPNFALRLILCALFACAAAMPAVAADAPQEIIAPTWFKPTFLDFRDDAREAGAANKHLMLYVGQNGCPWCKRLVEVNFRDMAIVERMQRSIDAIEINIVGSRDTVWFDGIHASEKVLAAKLKVRYTPTLLFFDERGYTVLRLNGYYEPERFLLALDYVANRSYRAQPDFQRYLQARGVSADERGSRVGAPQ